jgi:hypothetical protein
VSPLPTSLGRGLLAGAAGTTGLNVATYLDNAVRGRPPSEVPAKAAGRLADQAGVDLGDGDAAEQRREGAGALLGFATGVGAGALWGALHPALRRLPRPVAATVVGLGTMAASDASNVALGTAGDPREWPASSWLADLLPHLVYGAVTVVALDAFER